MLHIVRHEIASGLRDAKFLLMAAVALVAFISNGFIYAQNHRVDLEDWRNSVESTRDMLRMRADNLQSITGYAQLMTRPPNALAFIADGGGDKVANTFRVNTFTYGRPSISARGNEMLENLPRLDWVFIIGMVMTLLALMLSFNAVCGEKAAGTLKSLLSYPVSRTKLFLGKYLGLFLVMIIVLSLGALLNLTILHFMGALTLNQQTLFVIGWAFVLGLLLLSTMLLLGLAVGSMVHQPAVSLVILLILWMIGIIGIPGAARLVGEHAVEVPTPYEAQREQNDIFDQIWYNAPEGAGSWSSNLEYAKSEPARLRAQTVARIVSEREKATARLLNAQILQAEYIRTLGCVSPKGLLDDALQRLCSTGVHGYKDLYRRVRLYRDILHDYTVERDRMDETSPHTIYGWGLGGATSLTYSMRPVEFSGFPKWFSMWEADSRFNIQEWPLIHIVILLVLNINLAIIAFIALLRYDPR